jgi:sugar-specific transcriptional regulator TrmB/DNA-binding CsgD family transcriptional regulator
MSEEQSRNERVLASVGVSEAEELVYELLLQRPGAMITELLALSSLSRVRLGAVLHTLEEKGLISRTPSKPPRFVPVPPDEALEMLILDRQEQLDRTRRDVVELVRKFRRSLEAPVELIEIIDGREAVAQRFLQLQRLTQFQLRVLDSPPYAVPAGVVQDEVALLRRGARSRSIYDTCALEVPGELDEILKLVELGEEARVLSGLPVKLAMADDRLALIPLNHPIEGGAAALVHASPLLDALGMLFEMLWERAVPFRAVSPESEPVAQHEGLFGPDDIRLLTLLGAGLKDVAVARQLGVSLRTVERRVKRLMDSLGARTRFQAALLMERRERLEGRAIERVDLDAPGPATATPA